LDGLRSSALTVRDGDRAGKLLRMACCTVAVLEEARVRRAPPNEQHCRDCGDGCGKDDEYGPDEVHRQADPLHGSAVKPIRLPCVAAWDEGETPICGSADRPGSMSPDALPMPFCKTYCDARAPRPGLARLCESS
jgi:hypothetical protein